jgi:hypothetical protein
VMSRLWRAPSNRSSPSLLDPKSPDRAHKPRDRDRSWTRMEMNTIVVLEEDEVTRRAVSALLKRGNFKTILAGQILGSRVTYIPSTEGLPVIMFPASAPPSEDTSRSWRALAQSRVCTAQISWLVARQRPGLGDPCLRRSETARRHNF